MTDRTISVFVPTYNGADLIRPLIDGVLAQDLPKGFSLEFIITDSGSSDGTVEIIESYGDQIIFDQIANSDFGHGRTRQRAADRAHGEYILFLSQDATPASNRWLISMLEPLWFSSNVACVFGRQIPRPFAVPTIKREVSGVFNALGPANSFLIYEHVSLVDMVPTYTIDSFFSDVNSAVRTDILKRIPFRDVPYAEDQALAYDIQEAGYLKAYSAGGAVWHSNEYTAREYYHRKFDEYVGLIESAGIQFKPSYRELLTGWIRPTVADWVFTRHDGEYNRRAKIKFAVLSPLYNIALVRGKFNAAKYFNDAKRRGRLSLESRRKKK